MPNSHPAGLEKFKAMLKRRVELQVIQKLRRRIGRGDEQVVAGAGAGDVEELAFGVVDVFGQSLGP